MLQVLDVLVCPGVPALAGRILTSGNWALEYKYDDQWLFRAGWNHGDNAHYFGKR